MINGAKKKANLLHFLTSMELKELTCNKRNTLQIHNLVKLTTDVLKKTDYDGFCPNLQCTRFESSIRLRRDKGTKKK